MNSGLASEPVKVGVLSSASGGGAGIAACRVTDALNSASGITAEFIDMNALACRLPDDAAPPRSMSNRKMTDTHFTVEYPGYVRGWLIEMLKRYDVLNVHWASYLIGLAELDELSRAGMPILFTMHDFYYITGGCHYPAECDRHASGCLACPQVDRDQCSPDVIAENLKWKKRIFGRPNVHLAAPSRFLVDAACKSGIVPETRAHVLRNPYFAEKGVGPRPFGKIPRIVLIADSFAERRKGMPLAIESLADARRQLTVQEPGETPFIVDIIGNADDVLQSALEQSGLEYELHGIITDHRDLARRLSCCDFLLTCSFEDNWPNVLVEAGAYGVVPVVGPGHGCEEFVREFATGEVAGDYSVSCFAKSLITAIHKHHPEHVNTFSQSVSKVHDPDLVLSNYSEALEATMCDASSDVSLAR